MTYPTVSTNPTIQAEYEDARRRGQSHNFAEIVAFRQAPSLHGTKAAFMKGCDKKWISQLGEYVDGPDDLKAKCRAKGFGCHGMVNEPTPMRDVPDREPYQVAEDIVDEAVAEKLEENPGLAVRDQNDLREEVREEICPPMKGI